MLVACILFLWMFFAAATLERTADLGGISAPSGREVRALAYEYAAQWRHGMAGNSPLYMPGFFAVAIATWFWCAGRSLSRILLEGAVILITASVCASMLAPLAAQAILDNFAAREGFTASHAAVSGTWVAYVQGIYSLVTWSSLIIASRFSVRYRSLKPLLVPLVLNLILALVRPWTVADFTSQWVRQTLDGEMNAVLSFLVVPILSGFMAWDEVRTARLRKAAEAP